MADLPWLRTARMYRCALGTEVVEARLRALGIGEVTVSGQGAARRWSVSRPGPWRAQVTLTMAGGRAAVECEAAPGVRATTALFLAGCGAATALLVLLNIVTQVLHAWPLVPMVAALGAVAASTLVFFTDARAVTARIEKSAELSRDD